MASGMSYSTLQKQREICLLQISWIMTSGMPSRALQKEEFAWFRLGERQISWIMVSGMPSCTLQKKKGIEHKNNAICKIAPKQVFIE